MPKPLRMNSAQLNQMRQEEIKAFPGRLENQHPESDLQKVCVEWFHIQFPKSIIASFPNAAKRNFKLAAFEKKMGLVAGMPDLVIPVSRHNFHGLFVEMKSPDGRVMPHQKIIHEELDKEGYCVRIIRNFEDFKVMINGYLK